MTYPNIIISNDNLHSRVAHDVNILWNCLKDRNVKVTQGREYTINEDNMTSLCYLLNHSIASDKSFIEVIFKGKKEICKRKLCYIMLISFLNINKI